MATATTNQTAAERRAQLKAAADGYLDGLAKKDFSLIPYADNVTLRAPLCPGGVHQPLVGKEALRTVWWPPLPAALRDIRVIDHYINDSLTAIVVEAEVGIKGIANPLRVADRFTVNERGMIVEQENHFDPRDVTSPGWQNG
jgi:hypothetical protein